MPFAGIVVILPLKQKNQLKMLNFLKIFTIFVPSVEKNWRHQNTLMRVCQNEQLFKY